MKREQSAAKREKRKLLWGGSISAVQCEGAWNEGGKSPVESDYAECSGGVAHFKSVSYRDATGNLQKGPMPCWNVIPPGGIERIEKPDAYYPYRSGIDFYHRYREDIALFAEMGFQSLNLSISWARVMPHGIDGGINREGVEFYRDVLSELKRYDIEPIVTLFKYDMPCYLDDKYDGGWLDRSMVDEFEAFAKVCFVEYRDLVKYWITFNEINGIAMIGKEFGVISAQQAYQLGHHLMVASARAVRAAHDIDPSFKVGCMVYQGTTYPMTADPTDYLTVMEQTRKRTHYFGDTMVRGAYPSYAQKIWEDEGVELEWAPTDIADLQAGKVDYYAFSCYNSSCYTSHTDENAEIVGNLMKGLRNPYLDKSEWGWTIDPYVLKITMIELYDRYQIPLMIVENGLGATDVLEKDGSVHDPYRIDYLRSNIKGMLEALDEGVDLISYNSWGCIDLVAASSAQITKRYGYIYVDKDDTGAGTLKRYKKDSFYWYQKVIATNGEDLS